VLLVGTAHHLEDLDRQYTIAEDVSVDAIAVGPGAGVTAYVLLDGRRVARIVGDGLEPLAEIPLGLAQSLAWSTTALLVGVEDARLARLDLADATVSAVDSLLDVPGRATWENPAGPTPDLRSIAVTDAGTWLVNVHVGGVWRSADGGRRWEGVVAPDDDVHELAAGSGGTVVAAAARGFGWSLDDGRTWSWTTEGLHASYCRAAAVGGDRVYVTASTGPSTRDGRLYRARLGAPFEACAGGLPDSFPFNLDSGCLAADGDEVAVGTVDGRVWRSGDAGGHFEMLTERVGRVRVLRFA